MDFLLMLGDLTKEELCDELSPVLRILGIVILIIKIAAPVILIVVGMIDLAKAVTVNKEDEVKKAQNLLIKKAIAGVLVFLVITIVGLLMSIVGGNDYKECSTCINNPFSDECPVPSTVIEQD